MKNVRMMLALLMMTAALVGAGCGKADSSSEEAPAPGNAAEPVSEEVEKVQSEQAGSDHTDHEGHDHD